MKSDTHEGKRDMSAKCEHSLKAQQEETLASIRGLHPKGDKEETEAQWAFCCLRLNEAVKIIHTLLFHTHTDGLTRRQMCSRGRWENQAGEGKELRWG